MTQAAEILHITQPALSKQLKYLEAEFGAQLINIKRGQRGSNLQLTDAGKNFFMKKHSNYVLLKNPRIMQYNS